MQASSQYRLGVDIVIVVAQCRNIKDKRSDQVSPQWLFHINILTVVFMKASPRESDPTERNCPAGGTLWDTVNGT